MTLAERGNSAYEDSQVMNIVLECGDNILIDLKTGTVDEKLSKLNNRAGRYVSTLIDVHFLEVVKISVIDAIASDQKPKSLLELALAD